MKKSMILFLTTASLLYGLSTAIAEEEMNTGAVYPAAIFTFSERGIGAKGYGTSVSDILFANLVSDPSLFLVDREELNKTMEEQELNLSGMVNSAEAVQVGQLIGAKILITGSVVESGGTVYLVARMIGTETSRVLGESVKGKASDPLPELVETLAAKVAKTINERGGELVAAKQTNQDIVSAINAALGDQSRPTLLVNIEERHVARAPIDPAAETEFTMLSRETGFEVIDPAASQLNDVDIIIKGEGFSEFAMRRGNLVSVKARLEINAVERESDRILVSDSENTVVVDLSEEIAGKKALQQAAARIAERMLPKLVNQQ